MKELFEKSMGRFKPGMFKSEEDRMPLAMKSPDIVDDDFKKKLEEFEKNL